MTLGRLAALLLVLGLAVIIFFRSETTLFNVLLAGALGVSLVSALSRRRLPLVLTGILLIMHSGFFVIFTTATPTWLVVIFTAVTAAALTGTALSRQLTTTDLVIVGTVGGAGLMTAVLLPSSLIILAALASLPLLVGIPLLTEREQPLSALLTHATVTGIGGGGLIAATAVLFT